MKRKNTALRSAGILILIIFFSSACSTRPSGDAADPVPLQGQNFNNEINWLYTCLIADGDNPPSGISATEYTRHKNWIQERINRYRSGFLDPFALFMADKRPAHLPDIVLYPFGGSDLATAIATFPDANEITTISLEGAGDPRTLMSASSQLLYQGFSDFRSVLGNFLSMQDNTNDNVRASDKGPVPGQVSLSLAEAYIFGYRPVSLRFFRIENDGSLYYYTIEDINSLKNNRGERLHPAWDPPAYSVAFRNMEIIYTKKTASGEKKLIHRHIAANLHDSRFMNSPLSAHLEKKGRICAMSKAGAYLLWRNDFSGIRNHLLKHMIFMVADSTGILPRHASAGGFEMTTYGKFYGAFIDDEGGADAEELRKLFRSQPQREIPVRYGYSDIRRSNHLILYLQKQGR